MFATRLLAPALAGLCLIAGPRSGAATLAETFATNPLADGWQVFGDTNLFLWNSTNHNLQVTWDSSRPNSYFYHPLGTILGIDDDFSVAFDLQLSDANVLGTFEVAVGLLNLSDATSAGFCRPMAFSPNIFEFDFFPDGGYGPSISITMADRTVNPTNTDDFDFAFDDLPLNPGVAYHVVLTHAAGDTNITGVVLVDGQVYTTLPNAYPGPFTDIRLDTVSISSYSGANDIYGDELLAHGTVANVSVSLPPPPVQNLGLALGDNLCQAQFLSRSNWIYTLERTGDFKAWTSVSPATCGNASILLLQDTNPPPDNAFYRVRANRP
jgi:hypothetical protein